MFGLLVWVRGTLVVVGIFGRHPLGAVLVRFGLKELAETHESRVWLPFHVLSIC